MKEKIFWAPVVAGVAAVALTFSGCTKSNPTNQQAGNAPQLVASSNDAQKKAANGDHTGAAAEYAQLGESLMNASGPAPTPSSSPDAAAAAESARMGELLLMPEGFQYADKMFDLALQQDPTNAKALIYKSVTEPMMTLRGYIARIEPLIVSDADQRGLEQLRQNLKTYNMPELQDFSENLAQGQQPFQSYYDVQRFVRTQLLPTIQNSVDRLSKVDTTNPVQLNFTPTRVLINPVAKGGQYDYSYESCYSSSTGDVNCYNYNENYSYTDKTPRNLYFLDQHDLGILKNSMMGIVDSIRVATAYSMKDSEFAMRRLKALSEIRQSSGQRLSAQDVVGVLNSYTNLFTLETDNQLAPIAASTSQALKYGIDLANMKATLCDASPNARTIANSLIMPICIEESVVDSMRTGVNLLAGPTAVVIGTDSNGNSVAAVMDINAILSNPPKDLKALFPNQFDAQGNPMNYPDATMGGLFPNGDVITQLELIGPTANVRGAIRAVNKAVRAVKGHI